MTKTRVLEGGLLEGKGSLRGRGMESSPEKGWVDGCNYSLRKTNGDSFPLHGLKHLEPDLGVCWDLQFRWGDPSSSPSVPT